MTNLIRRQVVRATSFSMVGFSEGHKKRKEAGFDLLYRSVPGAGLEPAQALQPTGF